ncbi:hypothetical protein L228DRAFT_245908 [Xylona heveae TC161]|uniref:18S rRNA factor 2 n=1 Tax=Xylona heveae (strain CBS 132557 / TC161) TaxID=1328760 RepID=A0A165H9I6_XYLHT|nr:hypothetical protein L228DRAFT_245908 [Xylona heveae TC161]KZF23173.1 hypothetical protein L228DRAFT_245908 [Xylona heveae TC161]
MATQARNEWLDDRLSDEDEDNDQGYDSDAADESKGNRLARRGGSKRQKISKDDDYDEEDDDLSDEEEGELEPQKGRAREPTKPDVADQDEQVDEEYEGEEGQEDDDEGEEEEYEEGPSKPDLKPLTPKQLAAAQRAVKKTGVIYISRVPPFMKPQTMRHYLSPFGEIGRIFLTPEDPASHTRRVKSGGNKKRSFTDGWVEYKNKKDAKIVAETLNTQLIGGKKGNFYHDDVWNIKYLKGFKWHHLTEQIANENAERAARLRADVAQASRENKLLVRNIERGKMLDNMEAKRKRKRERGTGEIGDGNRRTEPVSLEPRRHFRQNEVKLKSAKDRGNVDQPDQVKRVLSKIF